MTRYSKTMTEALQEIREGFSAKQIKMAIGVASDKRYAGGNMTGAVDAIEKIKKGLSDHPQVAAVLKRQNEDLEEELELTEAKISKELAIKILSMRKDKKFVKVSGDFVPKIYLSGNDKDALKKEFGKLPRGLPSATSGMSVVSMINYALGSKDGRDPIDTEDGDSQSPKLISWNRGGKVIGKPRTVGDAVKIAGVRMESVELDEGKMKDMAMNIDDIVAKMKKDSKMKAFADKFKKDAMKSMDIAKSLEKVLPDYVAGKDIQKLMASYEEIEIDEMKMNDPKLNKIFDKLKRGDTVKLKTSSTINQGKDFVEYIVKAKNTVNKGRVEKITLVTKGNEKAVKKFLYKRDGQVTFAIGDMGASIDDIKENLDEMKEPFAVVDTADGNKVVGTASDEKGAKSIITSSELPPMKIKDKKTLKIVKVKKKQMIGQPIKEEPEKKMDKPDSAKAVDQSRDDKKKTRIAQLQLQIAKATETINKLNTQEKPDA